jgi:hypothetical protein
MGRGRTWLLSLADWEIGLARDLPWELLLSAHLGDLDVDLRGLSVARAFLATGIGDVRIVASEVVSGEVYGGSTLGNVTLIVPPEVTALVHVEPGAIARLQVDETRFLLVESGVYGTLGYDQKLAEGVQPFRVRLASTFGNIRLA